MTMPKYIVTASYITYCTMEVEAESQDEAWDIARAADGGDFTEDNSTDWEVVEIRESEEV
jgi:hypothetical protein